MLHSVPPSPCLPPLRLAICLIVGVLVFPFTFAFMSAEAAETERERETDAYILLVLVVDIYFMSQITFIGTWHTLEIHV